MTDAPSPHDVPETEDAFFDRIAVQMAELEFRRNLQRDKPRLFEPGQQHHRRHNLDMLTLHYQVNREAAANGRTIVERTKAHGFLHAMLLWTQGQILYVGLAPDDTPQWRPNPEVDDDLANPFDPPPF